MPSWVKVEHSGPDSSPDTAVDEEFEDTLSLIKRRRATATRTRSAQACSFCVRRKIKCTRRTRTPEFGEEEAENGPCDSCFSRGLDCEFRSRPPPGAGLLALRARILELEERLKAARGRNSETGYSTYPSAARNAFRSSPELDSFPDSDSFNALFQLFKHEIGPILLHEPFPGTEGYEEHEDSPLVAMSMACLASRYLNQDTSRWIGLYQKVRKALEPTLSGSVQPTLEVCRAINLIANFLGTSSDTEVSYFGALKLVGNVVEADGYGPPRSGHRRVDASSPRSRTTFEGSGRRLGIIGSPNPELGEKWLQNARFWFLQSIVLDGLGVRSRDQPDDFVRCLFHLA